MIAIMLLVMGLVFSAFSVVPATAATYYVSTSGHDIDNSCEAAETCTSPTCTTAKRTIQAGENCMAPGDTLYIRQGTYQENQITVNLQCTVGAPCLIAGYPTDARPLIQNVAPPTFNGTVGTIGFILSGDTTNYTTLRYVAIDGINLPKDRSCIAIYQQHVTIEDITCVNASRNAVYMAGTQAGGQRGDFAVLRNSVLEDCGRIQPPESFDTKGLGVYIASGNVLIENNIVDGCRGAGFGFAYEDSSNSIVRNNIVRHIGCSSPWGCISDTWDGGSGRITSARGVVIDTDGAHPLGPGNNQIYNNVIYDVRGNGANGNGRCFSFWTGSGQGGRPNLIANNTCYDTEVDYNGPVCGAGEDLDFFTMRNNIFSLITTDGALGKTCQEAATVDHNLTNPTVATTFINAAGGNFQLVPGATNAIDQGVATVSGRTCNGTACDIGAHETIPFVSASVENATPTTVTVCHQNNVSPPLLPATGCAVQTAGYTISNKTVTSCARNSSATNCMDLTVSAAFTNGATETVAYALTGNVSDSGGLIATEPLAFTGQAITNNVTTGEPPPGTGAILQNAVIRNAIIR